MKKKIVLAILLHSLLSKKKEEKEEEEEEEEEGSFDREETHRRIDPRLSHFCNLNLPLISFPSIISPSPFLPSPLFSLERAVAIFQVKFSIGSASNDTRAEN